MTGDFLGLRYRAVARGIAGSIGDDEDLAWKVVPLHGRIPTEAR
jgi:hypothetical protein